MVTSAMECKLNVKPLMGYMMHTEFWVGPCRGGIREEMTPEAEKARGAAYFEKYKETNRVFLLPDHLNATEYKGYIARMKFFIGARTHATIAAYSTGIPTMVLGYSVKSKGIAKDIFGEEKLVLGIDEISDAGKLIAKFEEMKNEEDSIKEILKNKIPKIKEMSQKAKTYLAEALL